MSESGLVATIAAVDWSQAARFLRLEDANVRWVLLGSTLLGIASGVLGTFALLRKEALLGDALAHAALPGVCVGFLITGSKDPFVLLLGAMATGALGTLTVTAITRLSRIKQDAAIGIVLSVFFGVGIVLLTTIQKLPEGKQSGLDHVLFGQAASLMREDVVVMVAMTTVLCLMVLALFKELAVVTFDRAYAASIGVPTARVELVLTTMIVLAVAIGLQAVGVVLMAAMLITPAAAARPWTDRLGPMVIISGAIGGFAGAAGTFVSFLAPKLPTGPVIVLAATCVFVLSLFAAPRRGLIARALQLRYTRARVLRENVLKTLYLLDERASVEPARGHSCDDIATARSGLPRVFAGALARLARFDLVRPAADHPGGATRFVLTEPGLREARRVVRNHRLWELYLVHQADVAPDHVHRDAEAIEHLLPPELVRVLDEQLDLPREDPHGKPIPVLERP